MPGRNTGGYSLIDLPSALTSEQGITNWKSRLFGVAIAVGGIALTAISHLAPGIWQKVLDSVGVAFISLGAVSIFFDLALRRNVQREMMRLVGLNREIVSSRVIAAKKSRNVDWNAVLAGRSSFLILLVDPLQWINSYFYLVLDSAREKKIEVDILVPDPNGAAAQQIADFYGRPLATVQASLVEAAATIESAWDARKAAGTMARGSEIRLRLMPEMANYSVVVSDHLAVTIFDGSIERNEFDGPFATLFGGSRMEYPLSWLVSQIKNARGCPRKFDAKVE